MIPVDCLLVLCLGTRYVLPLWLYRYGWPLPPPGTLLTTMSMLLLRILSVSVILQKPMFILMSMPKGVIKGHMKPGVCLVDVQGPSCSQSQLI